MSNTVNDSAIKKLKLLFTVVDRPKGEFYLVENILNTLEDKFATIRNGKGIAFAVPLSSVIGVNLYQFLSDNRMGRE